VINAFNRIVVVVLWLGLLAAIVYTTIFPDRTFSALMGGLSLAQEFLRVQQQANSRLLVQLLPIVDELDLAVNHLDANGRATSQEAVLESWVEGVRLIQRKLAVFLESQGVGRIESLGEPFNPELHEAVGMAQVEDSESGHIVEVLRQGYLLHGRVIQVAQVVVNQ